MDNNKEEEADEKIVEKPDSIFWGILEDEESGEMWVKFIMRFEDEGRDVTVNVSELGAVQSLMIMCEDFIRAKNETDKEEADIDAILEKIQRGANISLQLLQQYKAQGVRYEEAVLKTCMQWNLTKQQAKSVLALFIASMKLVESEIESHTDPPTPTGQEYNIGYR